MVYFNKLYRFFFGHQHIHIQTNSAKKAGNFHPCEWWKTIVFWHCVLDSPPLNFPSEVHEWSMSLENFLSNSWYLPNNLQTLAIRLVSKPSSPIENNLLQTWLETDVNSSYTPLSILMLPPPSEEVRFLCDGSLLPSTHQVV